MANNLISSNRNLLTLLIALLLVLALYSTLTMPDRRTTTERVGDAIHDLPKGIDKAQEQLKDRTPAQKLGDSVRDAEDNAQRSTSR